MNAREAIWAHVHAALDARRDPLEVAEVQRALSEDPALLGELADLGRGLELLERRRRGHARSLAAASVFLAMAGFAGAWHAARWSSELPEPLRSIDTAVVLTPAVAQPEPSLESPAQAADGSPPARPSSSRVIAFRAEVTLAGPLGRRTATSGSRGRSHAIATDLEDNGARIHVRSLVAVANPPSFLR